LNQVCERWLCTCLSLALDCEEQAQSGFRYQYSVYQLEYSRNLLFEVGGQMEQVFQALVDRRRAPLVVDQIKTILGRRHRPHRRRESGRSEGVIVVEKPTWGLTVFKLHCGGLTLKVYTKGERVLCLEAIAHHTRELRCLRSLPHFAEIISRLREILERFVETLSSIDACFIANDLLEKLPNPASVGASRVGDIDFNQLCMRRVIEALPVLAASPSGFTPSQLAAQVRSRSRPSDSPYGPRHTAYDLKRFRAKQLISMPFLSRRVKVKLTERESSWLERSAQWRSEADKGALSFLFVPALEQPTLQVNDRPPPAMVNVVQDLSPPRTHLRNFQSPILGIFMLALRFSLPRAYKCI
jgi:hypothetical protein